MEERSLAPSIRTRAAGTSAAFRETGSRRRVLRLPGVAGFSTCGFPGSEPDRKGSCSPGTSRRFPRPVAASGQGPDAGLRYRSAARRRWRAASSRPASRSTVSVPRSPGGAVGTYGEKALSRVRVPSLRLHPQVEPAPRQLAGQADDPPGSGRNPQARSGARSTPGRADPRCPRGQLAARSGARVEHHSTLPRPGVRSSGVGPASASATSRTTTSPKATSRKAGH